MTDDLISRADALAECQKVADDAKSYGIPQMSMGDHTYRDAIRALPAYEVDPWGWWMRDLTLPPEADGFLTRNPDRLSMATPPEEWEVTPLYVALTATPAADVAGRRIYLDLDGVMADFDAHFPAVFGIDHRSMADDAMWEKINAHPSYFEDMPLCQGAAEFFADIRLLHPIILTACPRTNYAHVAGQKRRWVQRHLGKDVTVIPVMGGHNKCLFMHAPGDVLIDDYAKNCGPWEKMGGVAILHTSFEDTRAALARMKEAKA